MKKIIAIFSVFALFGVTAPISVMAQDPPKNTVKRNPPKKGNTVKRSQMKKAVKANVPRAKMTK